MRMCCLRPQLRLGSGPEPRRLPRQWTGARNCWNSSPKSSSPLDPQGIPWNGHRCQSRVSSKDCGFCDGFCIQVLNWMMKTSPEWRLVRGIIPNCSFFELFSGYGIMIIQPQKWVWQSETEVSPWEAPVATSRKSQLESFSAAGGGSKLEFDSGTMWPTFKPLASWVFFF